MRTKPRIMTRRDVRKVAEIERQVYGEQAWQIADFRKYLQKPETHVGWVVEHYGETIGYLVYEVLATEVDILNLTISPEFQREGLGTLLIQFILDATGDRNLVTFVCETNTAAHWFLKSMGFLATEVMPGYWLSIRDAYCFEFCRYAQPRFRWHEKVLTNPKNRISQWI